MWNNSTTEKKAERVQQKKLSWRSKNTCIHRIMVVDPTGTEREFSNSQESVTLNGKIHHAIFMNH